MPRAGGAVIWDATEQDILQRRLINFLLKDVFNTISHEDLLKITGTNVWTHKGVPLTPAEITQLREEATFFQNSRLWEILENELRYHAQKTMYEKSQTPQDIVAGKLLLYLVDVVKTKLHEMTK